MEKKITLFRKYMIIIFGIFLLAGICSRFFCQFMLIRGNSMEPSYHNMQLVVLNKRFSEQTLSQGDVIAFRCEGLQAILVKRIAAIPGQTAVISNGTLYINGKPSEWYEKNAFHYSGLLEKELVLNKSEYIIIGDNISESKDSRYPEVGIVRFDSIIGKVISDSGNSGKNQEHYQDDL